LNWDEAREMERAGMAFGSHTHTHEILSKLSPDQQFRELFQSRAILEKELAKCIDTMSYPFGRKDAFSEETVRTLELTGYRTAFSFYGGLNLSGKINRFDIRRLGIDGQSLARFRLQTGFRAFRHVGSG